MAEDNKRHTRLKKKRCENETKDETKDESNDESFDESSDNESIEVTKVIPSKKCQDLKSTSSNSSSSSSYIQYRKPSEEGKEEDEKKEKRVVRKKVKEYESDDESLLDNNAEGEYSDVDDDNDLDYVPNENESDSSVCDEESIPNKIKIVRYKEKEGFVSEKIAMEADDTNEFDVTERNAFEGNIKKRRNVKPVIPGRPQFCAMSDEVAVVKLDHVLKCYYCGKISLGSTIFTSHIVDCYYGTQEERKRKNKLAKQRQKARDDATDDVRIKENEHKSKYMNQFFSSFDIQYNN